MKRFLAIAIALFSLPLFAQERLELTVDTIMRGHGLAGWPPRAVRWSRDSRSVFFEWKQYTDPIETERDTYVVGRDGRGLRKLTKEEAKHAPPTGGDETRDRNRVVYIDDGDVFLYDATTQRRRALTRTTATESRARFTHDERRVTFVRNNNLFVLSLDDGTVVQMTNIVAASERGPHVSLFEDEEKKRTASQKWVAEEAKKLSDVVARRAAEQERREEERKQAIAVAPLKLAPRQSVTDLHLTPDGKYVVAFFSTEPENGQKTIVPSYVTETGYTKDLPAREKVGDALSATRVASISTTDGTVKWLEHGLTARVESAREATREGVTESVTQEGVTSEETRERQDQTVPRNEQQVESTVEQTEKKEPEARHVSMSNLIWSDDGTKAVLPVRAVDNKDWWLLAFDPATAKTRVIFNEQDPAWVRWLFGRFAGFVPNSDTVWVLSERTGWTHLYTVPYSGGTPRALTSGEWEVDDVMISGDRRSFYVTASRESLHERHLYGIPVQGGAMVKLTAAIGFHDAVVSPDGTAFADVYSYTNRPPELYIATLRPAGEVRVTTSPAPEFFTYPWLDVPIVHFTARDGVEVPARIYKPEGWNGGPAVIFVHGAGYLQNVHRGWSTYFREYMFHHLLMERGYLVLDVDYRASAGYGRDWRTAIYRHMGGVDLTDHVDAAEWLTREHGVDPKRRGIYGGSYGGFIAFMAMFTTPDVFAAGAALRPVTDWAHYNHGYTANILNTPQSDPEAFRRSSPIYFAEGLKGALLICHGLIDVNVHAQDSIRLAQRLIELRKENWELALYPVEDHSFVEPTSWADEYKRVLKLFEVNLK